MIKYYSSFNKSQIYPKPLYCFFQLVFSLHVRLLHHRLTHVYHVLYCLLLDALQVHPFAIQVVLYLRIYFFVYFKITPVSLHLVDVHVVAVFLRLKGLASPNEPTDLVDVFVSDVDGMILMKGVLGEVFFVDGEGEGVSLDFFVLGEILDLFFDEVPHGKVVDFLLVFFVVFDQLLNAVVVQIFLLPSFRAVVEFLRVDFKIQQQVLIS